MASKAFSHFTHARFSKAAEPGVAHWTPCWVKSTVGVDAIHPEEHVAASSESVQDTIA